MFSCNCLNIKIEAVQNGSQEVKTVAPDFSDLNKEEKEDSFFKQDLRQLETSYISKTQPGLVQTREIGSWIINNCINCNVQTHAVHKERGATCVLVKSDLPSMEAIKNLEKSDKISKIFGIIIDTKDFENDDLQENTYLPTEVEPIVKNFKQTLSDSLRKETTEVEERIKKFTAEQYAYLDSVREKAFIEQRSLIKTVLANMTEHSKALTICDTVTKPIGKTPLTIKDSFDMHTPSMLNHPRHTPKRQRSSPGAAVNSFDAEGLFDFEGVDDVNPSVESDMDDSENEDEIRKEVTNGIPMIRNRASSISIAKSLPMNIPIFLPQYKNNENEDYDDTLPPEVNVDIAASIKKLAKSVHGNAVFGELPKPRFSTQI